MSKSKNLPVVRRSSGLLSAFRSNQASEQVTALQEAAFVERSHDTIRRDLAILRATDIGATTRATMDQAAEIADRLTSYSNPLAVQAASKIGETGLGGLDGALGQYIREG